MPLQSGDCILKMEAIFDDSDELKPCLISIMVVNKSKETVC